VHARWASRLALSGGRGTQERVPHGHRSLLLKHFGVPA
jgi:hypothetical protein